ncbi:MAG: pectinesterase family protein [Lysobacterales bacterium]
MRYPAFIPFVFLMSLLADSKPVLAQDYETEFTVAQDGTGDFTSIQAAIDASKTFPYERITIHLKNGIYKEKVEVYPWNPNISLIGESRDGAIITFDDYFDKMQRGRNSTIHTYTLRVRGNDFHAENLTIVNSSGPVGQAVALHIEADRVAIVNTTLKGYQDALYVAGEAYRSYFRDCYIEGSVDFIFGEGTALFENCEIKSLDNGYVTAASTPQGIEFGFVFNHCVLSADKGVDKVYLGRPWRQFAKTVFMNSKLGAHILPAGWHNWDRAANETTVYYAEYANSGIGAHTGDRVPWSHPLSGDEARKYTIENIFRGWNPAQYNH